MASDEEEIVYSSEEENDSEGEAPEAVSLKNTKESALDAVREAREREKKIKEAEKQKRREKDERLKKQSSEKKAKVSDKAWRLPEDVLEAAAEASKEVEEDDKSSSVQETSAKSNKKVFTDDDFPESATRPSKKAKRTKTNRFDVGGIQVVTLNGRSELSAELQASATSFRKKMLHGNYVKRGSAILEMSRKDRGAAIHFVRKAPPRTK
ncbi:hypothetical protein HK102_004932 [Quaeritorhiza haematococci]|nr:hypothetical protein HK102_004932 [Quaeritorhiza haematococci]